MKLGKVLVLLMVISILLTGCGGGSSEKPKPNCLVIKYHGTGLSYWETNRNANLCTDYSASINTEDRITYFCGDTIIIYKYDGDLEKVKAEYGVYNKDKVYGRKNQ